MENDKNNERENLNGKMNLTNIIINNTNKMNINNINIQKPYFQNLIPQNVISDLYIQNIIKNKYQHNLFHKEENNNNYYIIKRGSNIFLNNEINNYIINLCIKAIDFYINSNSNQIENKEIINRNILKYLNELIKGEWLILINDINLNYNFEFSLSGKKDEDLLIIKYNNYEIYICLLFLNINTEFSFENGNIKLNEEDNSKEKNNNKTEENHKNKETKVSEKDIKENNKIYNNVDLINNIEEKNQEKKAEEEIINENKKDEKEEESEEDEEETEEEDEEETDEKEERNNDVIFLDKKKEKEFNQENEKKEICKDENIKREDKKEDNKIEVIQDESKEEKNIEFVKQIIVEKAEEKKEGIQIKKEEFEQTSSDTKDEIINKGNNDKENNIEVINEIKNDKMEKKEDININNKNNNFIISNDIKNNNNKNEPHNNNKINIINSIDDNILSEKVDNEEINNIIDFRKRNIIKEEEDSKYNMKTFNFRLTNTRQYYKNKNRSRHKSGLSGEITYNSYTIKTEYNEQGKMDNINNIEGNDIFSIYNLTNYEEDNSNKPNDLIEPTNLYYLRQDIRICNPKAENNKQLYSNLQKKIKRMLINTKVPIFNLDNYKIIKTIGEGTYGQLYSVININTKKSYAMKELIANDINYFFQCLNSLGINYHNKHSNILDIYGIYVIIFGEKKFVIYALMDLAEGDWEKEIRRRKELYKYYKEQELVLILKQLVSALAFLQKRNIAHRDIKLENILLFPNKSKNKDSLDKVYKIGDFGEVKNKIKYSVILNTIRGTDYYMSPELLEGINKQKDFIKNNPHKSDVFSLGCCMMIAATLNYEIINTIRNPKNQIDLNNVIRSVLEKKYSKKFSDLITKMLVINENNRIDFINLQRVIRRKYL